MAEFATIRCYRDFEFSVKHIARYVHGPKISEFLKTVMATSESRATVLEKDAVFYRAQRGFGWRPVSDDREGSEAEDALSPDKMVPKAEFIGEGRVNSTGIPCLYLASNGKTAMSEVRPWIGSYISLASFKVIRDCRVVDCSKDRGRGSMGWMLSGKKAEPDAAGREAGVWGDIARAFSKPITANEPNSDYVPTQVLAEAFRSHGYDGIVYKSLLDADGINIALFDLAAAEMINCTLFSTRSVSFEFDQARNSYFISKHYPEIAAHSAELKKSAAAD